MSHVEEDGQDTQQYGYIVEEGLHYAAPVFPLKAWELITLPCARFAVIKSIEKFLLVAAGRFLFTSMPVIRSGGRWQSLKYYD